MNRFVNRAFGLAMVLAAAGAGAEEWQITEGATAAHDGDYLKFITFTVSGDDVQTQHVVRENSFKKWPPVKGCYYLVTDDSKAGDDDRIAKMKSYLNGDVESNSWDCRATLWSYHKGDKQLMGMFIGNSEGNNGSFRLFGATVLRPACKKKDAVVRIDEVARATYDNDTQVVTVTALDSDVVVATATLTDPSVNQWMVDVGAVSEGESEGESMGDVDGDGSSVVDARLLKLFLSYVADHSAHL